MYSGTRMANLLMKMYMYVVWTEELEGIPCMETCKGYN